MYKLFATMCFLVNGAVECTDYDDSDQVIYQELAKCEEMAAYRFYGMTDVFERYKQPYEKIVIGCKEIKEDS
tara:strand:- start:685 stop:900 length:216 start_codon:yes stop_codon:yes gene_type:complete